MYQIIIALLVIALLINHFHNYNVKHKLREEIKAAKERMKIPFDDYAKYQKAYVEFYRWLMMLKANCNSFDAKLIKIIHDKLEEIFKEE